jgi:hypothetical protein
LPGLLILGICWCIAFVIEARSAIAKVRRLERFSVRLRDAVFTSWMAADWIREPGLERALKRIRDAIDEVPK